MPELSIALSVFVLSSTILSCVLSSGCLGSSGSYGSSGGITVSAFTITVLVTVALFFAASSTVYVILYVPYFEILTVPVVTILLLKSPSLLSVAVAPGSIKR